MFSCLEGELPERANPSRNALNRGNFSVNTAYKRFTYLFSFTMNLSPSAGMDIMILLRWTRRSEILTGDAVLSKWLSIKYRRLNIWGSLNQMVCSWLDTISLCLCFKQVMISNHHTVYFPITNRLHRTETRAL